VQAHAGRAFMPGRRAVASTLTSPGLGSPTSRPLTHRTMSTSSSGVGAYCFTKASANHSRLEISSSSPQERSIVSKTLARTSPTGGSFTVLPEASLHLDGILGRLPNGSINTEEGVGKHLLYLLLIRLTVDLPRLRGASEGKGGALLSE